MHVKRSGFYAGKWKLLFSSSAISTYLAEQTFAINIICYKERGNSANTREHASTEQAYAMTIIEFHLTLPFDVQKGLFSVIYLLHSHYTFHNILFSHRSLFMTSHTFLFKKKNQGENVW